MPSQRVGYLLQGPFRICARAASRKSQHGRDKGRQLGSQRPGARRHEARTALVEHENRLIPAEAASGGHILGPRPPADLDSGSHHGPAKHAHVGADRQIRANPGSSDPRQIQPARSKPSPHSARGRAGGGEDRASPTAMGVPDSSGHQRSTRLSTIGAGMTLPAIRHSGPAGRGVRTRTAAPSRTARRPGIEPNETRKTIMRARATIGGGCIADHGPAAGNNQRCAARCKRRAHRISFRISTS